MTTSLSGSSLSRISSWAMTRLATVSSIGVPKKMMRSLARREYGSHSIRPRGVSWMKRGIGTYSLRIGSGRIGFELLVLVRLAVGRFDRQVDFVAFLVDHCGVFDKELQCFPPCDIR